MQQNTGKSLRENLLQSAKELLLGTIFIYQKDKKNKIKAKLLWKFLKATETRPQSYHICVAWLKTCFSHMAPLKLDCVSIRMERNCSECPYVQR